MNNHPHISELYAIYKLENQPFRKVHRMIDLFESIIKTHTVVILGEYFKQNKYSNAAKGLLASGLRTPSLGTWQLFSRVLYKELVAENHVFFQIDFAKEFEKLDKDLDNQNTNVISFRNEYAHGATPSDELCSEDIKRFEPFLESLLASKWLTDTALLEIEGKVSISNSSTAAALSLYPILLYKPEPNAQPYVFFNDLKNDKVGLLNYPLSKHYKEKDFFQEFNTYLPLKEWKNTGSSEFHQRIEELTETFKGRTQERLIIREFIEKKDKGYFSIQGNPGIGKSALIAQLFKDLSNQTPKLPIKLVEYFIRRGTAQANSTYLLNYLLKATDNHFSEGKTIQAEGKTNWDLQQQLFAKWRAYGNANPKEKMVFFIDGLDEGVENDILRYLPRENFKDILVIYGSRPGGHKDIETFWTELLIENHQPLLLTGLSKNDIRALLYEVGNKYEIEKDSAWIDTVEKRSEGNPLYLKLLCNAIENGSIPYNAPKALPTEINDYYKAILTRYANDSQDGDALLSSLFVFAAAFDYLTPVHLQLINGFGTAQSIRIESTLKEVLYENPLTEEVLDYQLFHESFREFLVQFYPTELKRAETKLLEFCSNWNTLQHTFEQRYALQYYTSHLTQNSSEHSILTLINLSKDKAYTDTQKNVLRGFTATKQLYQDIIHHTIKSANTDEALEAALALVDLKYEEQNDAASILAMVANNEIDLALQRITAFGGESKEDKQRQFILYMLCLMELTLLDSKDKPFSKFAIEKLLKHFDEKIPAGTSLINWTRFFSSYIIFLMAFEWEVMGLDYLTIFQRGKYFIVNWINEKESYSSIQIEVFQKNNIKFDIELENKEVNKSSNEGVLSEFLDKLDTFEISNQLDSIRQITDNNYKSRLLAFYSTYQFNSGQKQLAATIMDEAILYSKSIEDENERFLVIHIISIELTKQGFIDEAIIFAENIEFRSEKIMTYRDISENLALNDNFNSTVYVLKESLRINRGIKYNQKNSTISNISTKLAQNGLIEIALSYCNSIDGKWKSITLALISTEYFKLSKIDEAGFILNEAIKYLDSLSDNWSKNHALSIISCEATRQGKHKLALEYFQKIVTAESFVEWINEPLKSIVFEINNQDQFEMVLALIRKFNREDDRIISLSAFSTVLFKKGQIEIFNNIQQEINELIRGNISEYTRNQLLANIANEMVLQGRKDESELIMKEVIDFALHSDTDCDAWAIPEITIQLAIQKQWTLVEKIILKMSRLDRRQQCLSDIANNIYNIMSCIRALEQVSYINNEIIKLEYLKGWAKNVTVIDATKELIIEALPYFINDSESIEKLMQAHALHEAVFNAAPVDKIKQLNRTLNIQWFLDIQSQFPAPQNTSRLSTNLDTWLHEIADEDDQDQITLWAKQVAKGKITEEEFQAKIKDI